MVELLAVLTAGAMLALLALPALAGNRGKSKVMQCLNNLRQVGMGTALFTQENGYYPPLFRMANVSGWPNWVYDPSTFVVQSGSILWWQDALRLGGYAKGGNTFDCPAIKFPAGKNIGGSFSTNHTLGIGMNYPEFGVTVATSSSVLRRASQVTRPSQAIMFADAGAVTADTKYLGADEWLPDIPYDVATMQYFGGGCSYFRVPSDSTGYASGDSRSLNRHDKRCNFGFADGHAELLKNSKAGYNYYTPTGAASPQPDAAWWALRH